MRARLKWLAKARVDFAFETTLASPSFAPWLRALRASNYRAHLSSLSLPDPDLAVARVAERVRLGGHDVAEHVVRRRFASGLRNFFTVYRHVVDTWQVFDNSAMAFPRIIAPRRAGRPPRIMDPAASKNLLRRQG